MKTIPTPNQSLIYKLLTTSTWRSLWDSWDAYGRHWQRNQARSIHDFIDDPQVSIELTEYHYDGNEKPTEQFEKSNLRYTRYHLDKNDDHTNHTNHTEYNYTISLFHWLDKYFDFTSQDPFINKFNRLRKWKYEYIEERQEEYLESIWYQKGDTINSSNSESNLSQVYTLTPVYPLWSKPDSDDIEYYLLSVHQGCDVRGWYTADIMVHINPDDFPREDVYGSISYTQNTTITYTVSNSYDGYRITYDDHSDTEKQYSEIDTDNIHNFTLSL